MKTLKLSAALLAFGLVSNAHAGGPPPEPNLLISETVKSQTVFEGPSLDDLKSRIEVKTDRVWNMDFESATYIALASGDPLITASGSRFDRISLSSLVAGIPTKIQVPPASITKITVRRLEQGVGLTSWFGTGKPFVKCETFIQEFSDLQIELSDGRTLTQAAAGPMSRSKLGEKQGETCEELFGL